MSPDHLRRCRESRNWTQDQLAEVVGVDRRSVSRWETGSRPITRLVDRFLTLVLNLHDIPRQKLKKLSTAGPYPCD
jgi:transcriptional regulator with XRE-family HTH domain